MPGLESPATMTIESSGTVSGNSNSYVNGPLIIKNATGSKTFPIGKSNYRPATTNFSSSGSPTVQCEVFDNAPTSLRDVEGSANFGSG